MIESRSASPTARRYRDVDAISFVRSEYQRGRFAIRRKDGTSLQVVYHAYTDIADGMHLSFLMAADADAAGT